MKKGNISADATIMPSPLIATRFGQTPKKAIRPEDVLSDSKNSIQLPDGTVARKGSIKATFDNIDLLGTILREEAPGKARQGKVDAILQGVAEIIPVLHSLGVFRIFRASEWLQGNQNLGRILVGLTYLEAYFHQEDTSEQTRLLARFVEILATFSDPEILSRAEAVLKYTGKTSP
jgi:hypothetical protein